MLAKERRLPCHVPYEHMTHASLVQPAGVFRLRTFAVRAAADASPQCRLTVILARATGVRVAKQRVESDRS
jgi:hypothetical protein